MNDKYHSDALASRSDKPLSFVHLLERRYNRREILANGAKGALLASASFVPLGCAHFEDSHVDGVFRELHVSVDGKHHVADGHTVDVLLRWGDPLFHDQSIFDPWTLTADQQERRFGYNNDYVGFIRLPHSNRTLLCVNHEYPIGSMMFPNVTTLDDMTAEQCEIEKASLGISIVEIVKRGGRWAVHTKSSYNRRLSTRSSVFELTGPARGHSRLRTAADPTGTLVLGTMRNCAGGVTPWNSYLSCEENINTVFIGAVPIGHPETANHVRMGMPRVEQIWGRFDKRFDLSRTPNEPNRFGWVVEIDPLDPGSRPKKRTALGRFMHEGAEPVVAPGGRVVIYMGDDSEFEYLYKFVSTNAWNEQDRSANSDLLNSGTLYVARFDADGSLCWLPLIFGSGPLTEANGFTSQADVLIDTRRAGDVLGATPMDRPEGVKPNPQTGKVYVSCTKNLSRDVPGIANSVVHNAHGHIIELTEPDGDFSATESRWDLFLHCGRPSEETNWPEDTTADGWFCNPDNLAIDDRDRLWIATDQGKDWVKSGRTDGIWMVPTSGSDRGLPRHFFSGPVGAEITGPQFSDDQKTLFVSVQHPAADGTEAYDSRHRPSTFADPATRWPDFNALMPARPSIVVIQHLQGLPIGSGIDE